MRSVGKLPAFPVVPDFVAQGLSVREYMATHALTGIMANPVLYEVFAAGAGKLGLDAMVLTAVTLADKLVAALEESAK